jgi:hypothetical protein
MLVQAIGGSVAFVVGVFVLNSIGQASSGNVSLGQIALKNSMIVLTQIRHTNCSAESLTVCSLGTSSVFGGAVAILHSSQVSNFRIGLLLPSAQSDLMGSNLTVLVSKSCFVKSSVFSKALSGRLGEADGGGGAIYARSVALTNFSVTESTFSNNHVTVIGGTSGLPSSNCGGAIAVEAGFQNSSWAAISFSSFFNCTVQGDNISNVAVRGGAVHFLRAAHISVSQTSFVNCFIRNALSGSIVSGGSSIGAVVTGIMLVDNCNFEATRKQDFEETSTDLLFLTRNSSNADLHMSRCTFIVSHVALSVLCIDDDGARNIASCVGPNLVLKMLTLVQAALLQNSSAFKASGSTLMYFQSPKLVSITDSRMRCALPEFAAFREQTATSTTSSSAYSCKPCPPLQISLTATEVSLEDLSNARNVDRCIPVSGAKTFGCPFAIADCTTFVNVSIGFWTNLSDSGILKDARRCPRGYCGCIKPNKGTCPLPPPFSIDRNRDPLCNGNRTGKLCGGCPPNFTQSMDDRTCISNKACSESIWWAWMMSILGFGLYSLYIVVSLRKRDEGTFSCLLFYFQMSSFAINADESNAASAILEYAQVRSIVAMYEGACYASSMSAYNATAFKLIGPLLVFMFAVLWTWIIQKLQPMLLQRNIDISVSYSGTLAVVLLFIFSSIANVVFTLVECSSYSDSDSFVFIDGTVPCKDATWHILVCVAALLFLFPVAFSATLRMKQLPPGFREAVCGKFTEPMFYWGALTLSFRLLISVTQFMRVDVPNLMFFVRSLLSIGMLFLLVYLRPYVHHRTFWVDVACYVCLIAQFCLQIFAADRDFLGVAQSSITAGFFNDVLTWSAAIRRGLLIIICL